MNWPRDMARPDRHEGPEGPEDEAPSRGRSQEHEPPADAEVESLLRAMPLRRPSGALDRGVLSELRQARRPLRVPHGPRLLPLPPWATAAAVAAVIVLAFGLTIRSLSPHRPPQAVQTESHWQPGAPTTGRSPDPGPPERVAPGREHVTAPAPGKTVAGTAAPKQAAPPSPQPLRVIRTLAGVADDGVVGTVNGVPVRRIRRATVQQIVVFDPGRGTYVTYRRPTEQVLLVAAPAF